MAQVQYWWAIIRHEVQDLSLWKFLVIIASPIIMFIMYSLIIPPHLVNSEESEKYYYTVKRLFYILGIAVLVANFLDELIRGIDRKKLFKIILQGFLVILFIIGILVDRHLYHKILTPFTLVMIFFINAEAETFKNIWSFFLEKKTKRQATKS